MKNRGYSLTFFTLLLVVISATAQKIAKVQEAGLRIPENTNVDGKATEWHNKFQAYNNSTQVFYTLANDNERLYLAVQVTDPLVIRKIIAGGITLNITTPENTKGVAITYPLFDKHNQPLIDMHKRPVIIKDTAINIERIDSFMRASNYQLDMRSKEIKVTGIKEFKDTVLSVYNEVSLKAAAQFNQQSAYTYELSVPLKYLGLSVNGKKQF